MIGIMPTRQSLTALVRNALGFGAKMGTLRQQIRAVHYRRVVLPVSALLSTRTATSQFKFISGAGIRIGVGAQQRVAVRAARWRGYSTAAAEEGESKVWDFEGVGSPFFSSSFFCSS